MVLVGINAYVFLGSSRSLQSVARAAQAASTAKNQLELPPPAAPRPLAIRQGAVREGEGLSSALRRDGVAAADVDRALRALRPLIDFRKIHAGQRYKLAIDGDGALAALELRAGGTVYAVARAPGGKLLGAMGLASKGRTGHH